MSTINSIFNSSPDSIGYISTSVSTVQFQNAKEANKAETSKSIMLVENVSLSLQRGSQRRHFLNADSAMILGKARGTLTLTGLFASAKAMSSIINGNGSKDPCAVKQTIVIDASNLVACSSDPNVNAAGLKAGAKLTCKDCVANGFTLTNQLQQDGQLYQQATVTFEVTDVLMENPS